MKLFRTKIFKIALMALVAGSLFTSCQKDDPEVLVADNIDKQLAANPALSLFQYALKKTNLTSFTQGQGPFTIFAPTNDAFNEIGISNEAGINAADSNKLVQILTYHIQVGARTFVEIPFGPNAPMSTQSGFLQYATRFQGGSAFINGAKITKENIVASNGIIHIIDRILQPPFFNGLNTLAANPNYARMVQAINKTLVTASFTGGTVTIFAVPNSAMVAAGYDSTTIANLVVPSTAATLLSNIMRYHAIAQRIYPQDFKAIAYKTLHGSNLTVSLAGEVINVKGIGNPAAFQLGTSVPISNGVLYPINGLLRY